MALQTKTLTANGSKGHHKFTLTVIEESTSISNNSSTVSFTFKLSPIQTSWDWNSYADTAITYAVTIGNKTFTGSIPAYDGSSTVTLKNSNVLVTHNSDGTRSITVGFSVIDNTTARYTCGNASSSGTMALTLIPKQATITSAPSFNDESNPTITYSNPAGNSVSSLQACIADSNGSTIYVPYRDISKTGTSYTFSLTDAERNALRNATPNSNTLAVKFYIKTVIGTTTYYSNSAKTLTIVNANPTLSPTLTDIFPASASLTGSAAKHIRYYSDIQVTIGASAKKGATIKSQKVTCGSKSITTASGVLSDIESGVFVFSATDSRGNTVTQTINRTIVNYVHLTCNLQPNKPDATGNVRFTISGNYFNGNFGATDNTLVLKYRYKEETGEYGAWQTVTATKSGNTYSYSGTLTGLDYRKAYRIEANAADKLESVPSLAMPFKSSPIFDWGENDFNFNVPVTITDGYLVYPLLGLCNAMTKVYNCTVSIAAGANYSSASGSATICGNVLRCNIVATRSAAFSGDGANEVVAYVSINHGGKIAGMLNVSFPNGSSGAVASLYTSNVSQTEDTLDFTVNIAATAGSTTSINSFFQVPITINLNAFA